MRLKEVLERIDDSLSALTLSSATQISIHTREGQIGRIVKTSILRGRVTVESASGETKTVRGRDVADLDTPL